MPSFTANFPKGHGSKLVTLRDASTKEKHAIRIVLGVSVPIDDNVKKSQASNFEGDRFEAICQMLSGSYEIKEYQKPAQTISFMPFALIGSTVQRFALAGRSHDIARPKPEIDPEDTVINNDQASLEKVANFFEKNKQKFLDSANLFAGEAKGKADAWMISASNKLPQNCEVIDYQTLLHDELFSIIFNSMEKLFKTNKAFQKAFLYDAKEFVRREIDRYKKENAGEDMLPQDKAIIRYYSVLHFLEEIAVFLVLFLRKDIDMFAYPDNELESYREVRNNWAVIMQDVIAANLSDIGQEKALKKPVEWFKVVVQTAAKHKTKKQKTSDQQLDPKVADPSSSSLNGKVQAVSALVDRVVPNEEELGDFDFSDDGSDTSCTSAYSNSALTVTTSSNDGTASPPMSDGESIVSFQDDGRYGSPSAKQNSHFAPMPQALPQVCGSLPVPTFFPAPLEANLVPEKPKSTPGSPKSRRFSGETQQPNQGLDDADVVNTIARVATETTEDEKLLRLAKLLRFFQQTGKESTFNPNANANANAASIALFLDRPSPTQN